MRNKRNEVSDEWEANKKKDRQTDRVYVMYLPGCD